MDSKKLSKNLMEEIVERRIDQLVEEIDACWCDQCKADVRALALNNLPPQYIVNSAGDMFSRVHAQTIQRQVDVEAAIILAIETVRKNPGH